MNPHTVRRTLRAPVSGSDVGGGESGTVAQAKESIHETASRLKSAAGETAERAKAGAQRFASDTKQTTADRIGSYGSAIHNTAKSLEQQDPNIAWLTHRVADRVQGVADYLRDRDLSELRDDAESFARRHPVAFFGGLFVAGLVVGNLLKARPASDEMQERDRSNASGSEDPLVEGETSGL